MLQNCLFLSLLENAFELANEILVLIAYSQKLYLNAHSNLFSGATGQSSSTYTLLCIREAKAHVSLRCSHMR